MKKLNIKMMVMLVCMTLGLAIQASAQINNNELCFYKRTEGSGNQNQYLVVKFDYYQDKVFICTSPYIKEFLKNNSNYFENNVTWKKGDYSDNGKPVYVSEYEYDINTSTSSREVYRRNSPAGKRWDINGIESYESESNYFYAFSKDVSSIIWWQEYVNNGKIKGKTYYIRVSKEDLLPKAANHDFLID